MSDEHQREQLNFSDQSYFGLDWAWKMGVVDSRLKALETGVQHLVAKMEVADGKLLANTLRLERVESDIQKLDEKFDALEAKIETKFDAHDAKNDALEAKFDTKFDALDAKIDALEDKFDAKIDALEDKFDAKIDALEDKFDAKFDALEAKMEARDNKFEAKMDARDIKYEAKFDAHDARLSALQETVNRMDERHGTDRAIMFLILAAVLAGFIERFFFN